VFSIILLSFCAFRILEYLLGYFLEILCMKILFCLCAGLIFYAWREKKYLRGALDSAQFFIA
jgi:hypothetical protein